ncbi:MAG TPA: glycosyltransferase family 2 protein [Bacteroidia bacterium]|nr:glycosyltransferase family 2 protein [Bacteroidia bacterium]
MKVAGFTIVRNAEKFDYPVKESILSVLPIVDIFIVSIGQSEDNTEGIIRSIPSDKIKIVHSVWDDNLREGGKVLAIETNKAKEQIPSDIDWCFYIQSDEVINENDYEKIQQAMKENLYNPDVEGLLFNYYHFFGNYDYIATSRKWYRKEIRIIRNNKDILSYKDAQGFRKLNNEKLKVKETGAYIYHYGWVRHPKAQLEKQKNFHKLWHDDEWVKQHIDEEKILNYKVNDILEKFNGKHPFVMKDRIEKYNWHFNYSKDDIKLPFKEKLLYKFEQLTGYRVGEYKNYRMI